MAAAHIYLSQEAKTKKTRFKKCGFSVVFAHAGSGHRQAATKPHFLKTIFFVFSSSLAPHMGDTEALFLKPVFFFVFPSSLPPHGCTRPVGKPRFFFLFSSSLAPHMIDTEASLTHVGGDVLENHTRQVHFQRRNEQ